MVTAVNTEINLSISIDIEVEDSTPVWHSYGRTDEVPDFLEESQAPIHLLLLSEQIRIYTYSGEEIDMVML